MNEPHGLHEALSEQHNEKMTVLARLEILIRILSQKDADEVVGKKQWKTYAGDTGYVDVTAIQLAQEKQAEVDAEYKVLAVIKEMIQERGIVMP